MHAGGRVIVTALVIAKRIRKGVRMPQCSYRLRFGLLAYRTGQGPFTLGGFGGLNGHATLIPTVLRHICLLVGMLAARRMPMVRIIRAPRLGKGMIARIATGSKQEATHRQQTNACQIKKRRKEQ